MVEIRLMRYFIAVAEELSFTRAAKRLHMAVPPLSVQIRRLEQEIGAQLLTRDGRKIALTAAGEVFLHEARRTLAQVHRTITLTRRVAGGDTGSLEIGYNAVAEFGLLPQIIDAFREKWPKVHLALHGMRTPDQLEALRRDELDIGFICPPAFVEDLDMQLLQKQPFIAVLPADHRLVTLPVISFQDLSGEPLIMYSRGIDTDAAQQIEKAFAASAAVMSVSFEVDTATAMVEFVARGSGCSLMPEYVRRFQRKDVVCKPLGPPPIVRALAIAKKKETDGLTDTFFRFAPEIAANPQSGSVS
jgi:DNA-binding transcriptional LysR family regulator